jgi:hypothetical protein
VGLSQSPVEIDGPIDVRAVLHIDRHHPPQLAGAADQLLDSRANGIDVDIDAEVGGLDRDVRVESAFVDPIQDPEEVLCDGIGFLGRRNVFSEEREDGRHP